MNVLFLNTDVIKMSIFMPNSYNIGQMPFNMGSRNLLTRLRSEKDLNIVITCDWRTLSKEDVIKAFKERGLRIPIVGSIPNFGAQKGQEISMWIENNKVDKFVIVDRDMDEIKPWFDNFVEVDKYNSFNQKHFTQCLNILNI